jgi:ABC-type antimicrobial peptide transport system permease subunit
MLATVTERTREIGIRRALGARRSDVLRQFLVESIVLAIVGAGTGILGGILLLPLTEQARKLLIANAPEVVASLPDVVRTVRPVLVPWSLPLSVGIALVVGVLFGVYPAVQAARLDPIEALRHE